MGRYVVSTGIIFRVHSIDDKVQEEPQLGGFQLYIKGENISNRRKPLKEMVSKLIHFGESMTLQALADVWGENVNTVNKIEMMLFYLTS